MARAYKGCEMAAQSLVIVDVFREQYSELYRTLVKADTSRRLVVTDLYSKNIITDHEHDKIKQLEASREAEVATDEMLKRIKTRLSLFPTDISKVLEVLRREEVLVPIVTSMRMKLSPSPSEPAVSTSPQSDTSSMTSSEASLQPMEHDRQKGTVIKCTVPCECL